MAAALRMPDLPRATVEITAPPAEEAPRPAGEAPPLTELRGALFRACTAAAGGTAQCVEPSPGETPAVTVVVVFRASDHARVEVSARRGDAPFGTRDLTFVPSDARIERYRTIGYAAGTLVAEYLADVAERESARTAAAGEAQETAPGDAATTGAAAPPPAGAAPSATKSDVADPKGSEDASPPRGLPVATIDLGVLHGTAFEGGAMRTGGAARGALYFGPAFATASFGYSVRSKRDDAPSASFIVLSAGAGYLVPFSVFQVAGRLEAVVERLASEGEAPSGRSGSASRFLGGARVGADFAWLPLPSLGVVVSGDALMRAAPTELVIEGRTVATVPVLDFAGTAGLRLSLH